MIPQGLKIAIHRDGGYGDGVLANAFARSVKDAAAPREIHGFGNGRTLEILSPVCNRVSARPSPTAFPHFDLWFEPRPVPSVTGNKAKAIFPEVVSGELSLIRDHYQKRRPAAVIDYYRRQGCVGQMELFSKVFGIPCEITRAFVPTSELPTPRKEWFATLGAGVAGPMHQAKSLTVKKWSAICEWFNKHKIPIYQVGAPEEEAIPGAIPMMHLEMPQQLWIVKEATLHVGADGFLAHVASACNTPAVVLWGVTPPEVWGHRNQIWIKSPAARNLWWTKPEWWKDPACTQIMDEIEVEEVTETIAEFLNGLPL